MTDGAITIWIEERAKHLGFARCGVVRAEKFPELARAETWLAQGYAGEMSYLADPRRSDLQAVMMGIRSVIVCALTYNTAKPGMSEALGVPRSEKHFDEPHGWISRYAWGADYHEVLNAKLKVLAEELRGQFTEPSDARVYADTGPINERVLAKYAGLGWLGKNTLLLNEELGSYFFLGVILTTLDLPPTLGLAEGPPPDRCGTCRRCIDACPTNALIEPYVMDARKCISYLTIELRGRIPDDLREAMGQHVFGCDICQDVCPWNRNAPVTGAEEFQPRTYPARTQGAGMVTASGSNSAKNDGAHRENLDSNRFGEESLYAPRLEWLASMNENEFRETFLGSPIKRTKWRGLLRNVCIALGNSRDELGPGARERVIDTLQRLGECGEESIAESARWAISRIEQSEANAPSVIVTGQ